jgi:hypothetical protein
VSNSERWVRTRNVACANCPRRFIRLTSDRYQVCLHCVTWARLAMAGIGPADPALGRIIAYNASVRTARERKAA